MSKCSSCQAEIVWAETKTGKPMPLDVPAVRYNQSKRGLFGIVMGKQGRIALAVTDLPEEIHYEIMVWRSHFATCPNADRHRR